MTQLSYQFKTCNYIHLVEPSKSKHVAKVQTIKVNILD